jgi:tetratricopeptide (TPR) repeat protein
MPVKPKKKNEVVLCCRRRIRALLWTLLAGVSPVLAQTAAPLDTAAASAYTIRAYDERIQYGIDLIYSLKFAAADRYFEAIIAADPENPLGHFFLAMVTWWRVLIDLEDRKHDEAFYRLLEKSIEVCDRRLQQDPDDFDAILFKAGSIGFRGRLRGDRGQFVRAAKDGLKSLPLLKRSRQMEPTNKDILFGQGIYNYFAEVMPREHPIVRPVMWFLPDGDREKGLQQLREVSQEGRYARAEAAYFLVQIYRLFEKDKQKALHYVEKLYARYPDNALFHRYTARILADLGHWKRGVQLFQEVVHRSEEGRVGYHVRGHVEALYYLGKHAFYQNRLQDAAAAFTAADSLGRTLSEKSENDYATLTNLLLGMTYDLQGKRTAAVACYERVEELDGDGANHKLARQYLEKPYRESR